MSTRPDFDRSVTAWLDEQAPMREPDGLFERVSADLARTRRLPGWAIPERWLPMQTTSRFGTASRAAIIVALIALLVAAFAAIGVASQPAIEPAPAIGIAKNGLIAFPHDWDMWILEPDGSDPRPLVATPDLEMSGVWSPDGTRLAFWSMAFEGDPMDPADVDAAFSDPDRDLSVTVVRADGSDPKVLIDGLNWSDDYGTGLSWSHDGTRLAISHNVIEDGTPTNVITILPLDGQPPTRLVTGGSDPYWSPDDQTIAYHGKRHVGGDGSPDGDGVWLIGSDGGDDRRLSETYGSGGAFDGPVWSPDGTRIAFYGQGDGYHDVWVARADGSGEVAIGTETADEYWPRWSPDGTRIAFDRVVDSANNAPQFVVTDPDGSNQVMLDHPLAGPRYPTWSPDGHSILGMQLDDSHTDVVGFQLVDPDGQRRAVELYRGKIDGDPSWQRLAP
jgi:TolB protein